MKENKFKEVRVSSKTEPKQLATSILYSLQMDINVKVYAIGESIKVMTKGLAILNLIKASDMTLDFQPMLEYVQTNTGIKNAIVFMITRK